MRALASYTDHGTKGLLFGAGLVCALPLSGCRDAYPLEPTFCDDWCRATLRAGCEDEPENCVRDCELTKASDACLGPQRRLLGCYEEARDSDFVCAGSEFESDTRVKPDVCRVERDTLYECEAPGIGICLALCREQQRTQLDRAYDSETGLVNYTRLVDGGAAPACPSLDQPCETLCFSVFGFESDALSVALSDDEANWPDAGPSDPDEVRTCIEDALLGCFVPGGDADGGAPGRSRRRLRSIEDVIVDCTGFP